jgi:hypothetical protein
MCFPLKNVLMLMFRVHASETWNRSRPEPCAKNIAGCRIIQPGTLDVRILSASTGIFVARIPDLRTFAM